MSAPYIVAIGAACMDEYFAADGWVAEGDKLLVRPMEQQVGGMIPNAACVMAGLGSPVYLLDYMNGGAVSQKLQADLAGYGLDVSHIVTDDRLPDARCIIVLTPQERTILVVDYERPPRQVPPETLALLRGAAYVYTTMTELRRFENHLALADDLRAHGARLVFDLEPATFESAGDPLFARADVLFFNETGLAKYSAGRDPDGCIDALLAGGCRVVVTTLGADGCDCRSAGARVRLPGCRVPVVDTTGAGDTFNGAFVHGLLSGAPLEEAARLANAAAGRAVTRMGGRGGVATRDEVLEFQRQLQNGKEHAQ